MFAGLLVGRSARGRCKKLGSRRWNCAENAKYFDPCCVFERIVGSYQTAGQLEIRPATQSSGIASWGLFSRRHQEWNIQNVNSKILRASFFVGNVVPTEEGFAQAAIPRILLNLDSVVSMQGLGSQHLLRGRSTSVKGEQRQTTVLFWPLGIYGHVRPK